MGTMAKALHSGNAASNGIHAALLARQGFTGDPEILEAPLGLVSAICLPGEFDWQPITSQLGRPFESERAPGVKTFPSCTPSHRPIDGVLAIRRAHRFELDEVESIEANLHYFSLLRTDPQTGLEAGFSGPYLLAVALIDGALGVDHLSDDRIQDPQVRAMMARVRHVPELAPADGPERVAIRLRDGRVLTTEVAELRRLSTTEEIEAKYRDGAGRVLRSEAVERLLQQTMTIEQLPDIGDLMATTGDSADRR
jgi:2-methylcitrate dehydratase PrpD